MSTMGKCISKFGMHILQENIIQNGNYDTCYHTDEAWGNYAKWNKPDWERQDCMVLFISGIFFLKKNKIHRNRIGKFTIQGKYEEFRIPDVVFSAWGIGCT